MNKTMSCMLIDKNKLNTFLDKFLNKILNIVYHSVSLFHLAMHNHTFFKRQINVKEYKEFPD